jgi:hypothetical protein
MGRVKTPAWPLLKLKTIMKNVPKMKNPPPPPKKHRISFKVVNSITGDPATCEEINELVNADDPQLFYSWHNMPSESNKGVVSVNLDSFSSDKYHLKPNIKPQRPQMPPTRTINHGRISFSKIGPVERVIWLLITGFIFILLFII